MFGVYCRILYLHVVSFLFHIVSNSLFSFSRSTIDAKEAFDIGLANRIVPPKSALSVAMEISQEMATLPQRCLRVDRMSVYNAAFEGESLEESLNFEYEHGKSVINVESIEGANRFIHNKYDSLRSYNWSVLPIGSLTYLSFLQLLII